MAKIDVSQKAGALFYLLEQENCLSIEEIYKKMMMRGEKHVLLALGWLARDNRITFDDNNGETCVRVNSIPMTEVHY